MIKTSKNIVKSYKILLWVNFIFITSFLIWCKNPKLITAEIELLNQSNHFYKNFNNIPRIKLIITNNSLENIIMIYNSNIESDVVLQKVFVKNLFEVELDKMIFFEDSSLSIPYNKDINTTEKYINQRNIEITKDKIELGKSLLNEFTNKTSMYYVNNFNDTGINHFINLKPGESYIKEFEIPEICFYNFKSSIQLKQNTDTKLCQEFLKVYMKQGLYNKNMMFGDHRITDFNIKIISNKLYIPKPKGKNLNSSKKLYSTSPIYM